MLGVITVTKPVVAPTGTVALISEFPMTLNVAAVPLKVTPVVPIKSFPKIVTLRPTLPEGGSVSTNGSSPTDKLKAVPQP